LKLLVGEFLVFLALGAFAGVLAGLLGVGGGLVIVPVVAAVLAHQGITGDVVMHLALGTSLATIMFTSVSSVRAHHARGAVQWQAVGQLTPGIVIGALIGSRVAHHLPGENLRLIFGLFVILVALQMGLGAKPAPHRQLPRRLGMGVAGGVIGFLSAIVGIGGGSLTVPFLHYCNLSMRAAVATSAACGFPIALAGAAGFLVNGWDVAGRPSGSLGYVYLPALAGIALASVFFAPVGARLAHTVPADKLKRFFALLLAIIGLRMLIL
jgi:uncharacterized membrane protein YfcA